nr:MAG TPA: hypothetical protein [Caudoviricetes sp.]
MTLALTTTFHKYLVLQGGLKYDHIGVCVSSVQLHG